MKSSSLLTEVQLFLTRHAQQERKLSRATILSYRDTLKLFILFQRDHCRCRPDRLDINALSYESILQFLDHLETDRRASISTRNQRLAALRSLSRYIIFRHPDHADTLSRCLVVPMKKRSKKSRDFLESSEITALLKTVDQTQWIGRRNHLMLDLAIRTGLRVSELVGVRRDSFRFGKAPYVSVEGKGRKERSIPLDKALAKTVSRWLTLDLPADGLYVFPTARGHMMSVDAFQSALRKYVALARTATSSLKKKRISPHTLRHTTAMQMLNRGVDVEIIALWLGHEQLETTQIYFSESLAIKRKALKQTRFQSNIQPIERRHSELSFLDDL